MLIGKNSLTDEAVEKSKICVPGKYTTANLLFSLKYPNAQQKEFVVFSDIEHKLLSDEFDAGVIIHENRFTYEQKGLKKIIDLGEFWEQTYKAPIPLGGIAIRRNMELETQLSVERIIKRSIEFAFAHPESSKEFVAQHSQEMSAAVCKQHIDLYVNTFSLELGSEGEKAVNTLYKIAQENKIIPALKKPVFIQ